VSTHIHENIMEYGEILILLLYTTNLKFKVKISLLLEDIVV